MSVAVTAKRDATRPELADPHILSMTGWLMTGWLAGQSVGRVGSRALPTGYMCQSPVRAAAYTRPPRLASAAPRTFFYAYSCVSHGSLLLFLSSGEPRRAGGIFSPWYSRPPSQPPPPPPIPRHGIESSRHGVRTEYGRRACETEGKKKREKKERTAKRLEAGRRSRDSRAIELKGARTKKRERKRDKGRIGWGGAFQSRSEAPRVPTTIEKGETCRRGYRRGQ